MRKGLPFICGATLILGGGSLALAAPQSPELAKLSDAKAFVLQVEDGDRTDGYFFEVDDSDGDYSDSDSDSDNDGRRPLWLKHPHDDDCRAVPRRAYRDSDDDGDFDDSSD